MRLGIDLTPFFTDSNHRGIGRYAKGLLEELVDINDMDQFHFLNIFGEYQADLKLNERCYLHRYNCGPYLKKEGKLVLSDPAMEEYIQAAIDNFVNSSKIDAMLFLSMMENNDTIRAEWLSDIYKIGILYDLIPMLYQDAYLGSDEARETYFRALEFVKKMDLLLAISETTKQDAVRLLNISPDKIIVIHAGVDQQFLTIAKEAHTSLQEKISHKEPYFLFVGVVDPRKNIKKAIQAFSINSVAKERNMKFAIAGELSEASKADVQDCAFQFGVQDRVVLTGFVSDDKVIELYRNAVALLFPSLYEGFGLPVLEAMCCGTAVITSNNSSLQEVAKGYACLVDPHHAKSISAGITKLMENPRETAQIVLSAKEYAQAFHWKRVAKTAHDAIQSLLATPKMKRSEFNPLVVHSELLQLIADQYAKYELTFRWPDALALAKEVTRLEHAEVSQGTQLGARFLFDVTVGCETLRANSGAGIIRVSVQLRRALASYGQVIPVILKNVDGKCVLVKVDMDTLQETSAIEAKAGDIYIMAEIQVRGIHVPADYPSVLQLREMGVKTYFVIYDLLPIQMPQYFQPIMRTGFYGYIDEGLRDYDGILTDSMTVADDVWQYYQTRSSEIGRHEPIRIGYFHLGMDSFRNIEKGVPFAVKVAFKGNQPVFLMVGTIEPRKGHELVLRAFSKLWRDGADVKLCIIGRVGWLTEAFVQHMKQHAEFGRKLQLFEDAGDPTLEYAYQHATALIQASEGEGFGLPIIEAACYRLPLLCSDIPVFHEIAGEHALYFKRDPDALAKCVSEFELARQAGNVIDTSRIELLTWDDVAKRVFMMMKNDVDWKYFE